MLRCIPAFLPPCIFAGEPLTVLAEVLSRNSAADDALILHATRKSDHTSINIEAPLDNAYDIGIEDDTLYVMHALGCVESLLQGTSTLHREKDGARANPQPSESTVREQVTKLAVQEKFVTPYTSATGVILRCDPVDTKKIEINEIPLKTPFGKSLFGNNVYDDAINIYTSGTLGIGCMHPCATIDVSAAPGGDCPEEEEEEMGFDLFSDCTRDPKKPSSAPISSYHVIHNADIIAYLNRERHTEGYWTYAEDLIQTLSEWSGSSPQKRSRFGD